MQMCNLYSVIITLLFTIYSVRYVLMIYSMGSEVEFISIHCTAVRLSCYKARLDDVISGAQNILFVCMRSLAIVLFAAADLRPCNSQI